jgi:hypothetical protein
MAGCVHKQENQSLNWHQVHHFGAGLHCRVSGDLFYKKQTPAEAKQIMRKRIGVYNSSCSHKNNDNLHVGSDLGYFGSEIHKKSPALASGTLK